MNFTAVPHGTLGYLTVWPSDQARPVVSTLNAISGQITANAAIVPAAANGDISVFVTNDSDVVIDIDGYFGPPSPTGLSLFPITPCRVFDTRTPVNGESPIDGSVPVDVQASDCSVPSSGQVYVVNATVVPSAPLGYLTLWPDGSNQPVVSTLNSLDGVVSSNMAVVPAANGKLDAFVTSATNLILDISGYFGIPDALPNSLPMSPLYLSSAGIDLNSPFTVQFTNSAGYSVKENALRVSPDGTIVVAVPFYVDPITGQTGPGTVSVTVSQGNYSTPPQTLSIQDLPSVSSYGLQPGEATRAMLVFDATLLARRINQLQAFQNLPGNTVDTTAAQSVLQSFLAATIQARQDVDQLSQNPSLVFTDVTLPSGLVMQFDSNALDMMDRVNANFMLQNIGPLVQQNGTSESEGSARRLSGGPNDVVSTIEAIAHAMQSTNGVKDMTESIETAQNAKSWTDYLKSSAQAASGTTDLLVGTATISESKETVAIGLVGAVLQHARVIGDAFAQDAAFVVGWATGDKALQDVAVQAMNEAQSANIDALSDLVITLVGGPSATEVIPSLGSVSSIAKYFKNVYDLYSNGQEAVADQTQEAVTNDAATSPMPGPQNFGYVDGQLTISNSQGITASQTGVDLSSNGVDITTLADPSGNYEVLEPLNDSSINYSNVELNAYDPITDQTINSENIDLSSLTFSNPFQAPMLTGTCIDNDADGDDPDCDSTAQVRKPSAASKSTMPAGRVRK